MSESPHKEILISSHGVMSVLARGTRQVGTVHVSDRTRTSAAASCTRSPNVQQGVRPRVSPLSYAREGTHAHLII
jgi:hypothetical protein